MVTVLKKGVGYYSIKEENYTYPTPVNRSIKLTKE
jgi:hypothetical protein